MQQAPTLRSRSVWADLDALVLEEADALRAFAGSFAEIPDLDSDEAFLSRVSAFLRGHHDPAALIERLCADLGLFAPGGAALPDAGLDPAATATDLEDSAAPDPDDPDAPAANEAEPGA